MAKPSVNKEIMMAVEMCGLGLFGVDHLIAGRVGTGLLKMFTLGGLGVWALVDGVLVGQKCLTQSDEPVYFARWSKDSHHDTALVLVIVAITMSLLTSAITANVRMVLSSLRL